MEKVFRSLAYPCLALSFEPYSCGNLWTTPLAVFALSFQEGSSLR